ncbi:hypothetical protein MKW98_024523 [Papaver atlanticum]|uniref:Uncharacterized protein n=1 Tax=Papaver atlanticum TaxID=357466 RepID=A0AAD4RVU2_9MAGN|nr:hypothetical protein MKW98_024523 [Papaver atlanticum]
MSYKSLPFGFGLFVFGILAFDAYSEMAAAANAYCKPGEIEFTFGITPGCNTPLIGCTDKCTFWCSAKGLPTRTICTGQGGIIAQFACVCCCGTGTPVPVPPSLPPPSPPPPPPPRNPNDLCLPAETSFTSTPTSGTCTPNTCPACTCPGGAAPTEDSCTLNLCQCCCT